MGSRYGDAPAPGCDMLRSPMSRLASYAKISRTASTWHLEAKPQSDSAIRGDTTSHASGIEDHLVNGQASTLLLAHHMLMKFIASPSTHVRTYTFGRCKIFWSGPHLPCIEKKLSRA